MCAVVGGEFAKDEDEGGRISTVPFPSHMVIAVVRNGDVVMVINVQEVESLTPFQYCAS